MKKENEKVMIISWRWKTFEVAKRVVNKELLDKPEFRRAVEVAAPFLDELFDEYKICEQQPDGDILPVSPPSKIVRTFIENPLNDPKSPTLSYLLKLIQYF